MVSLEETSRKVEMLREEFEQRSNEVLIDIIGSMLSHTRRGESFEQWCSHQRECYLVVFMEKFNEILSTKTIPLFTLDDFKNMYERMKNWRGKRVY